MKTSVVSCRMAELTLNIDESYVAMINYYSNILSDLKFYVTNLICTCIDPRTCRFLTFVLLIAHNYTFLS